ncbi:MAG: hypothetical protein CMP54_03950 [Flavobacteriales bacterium]|nr:hypothetical protein [Flavobacteriales bacterium]
MQRRILLDAVGERGGVERVNAQNAVRHAAKRNARPPIARARVQRRLRTAVEQEDGAAVAVVGRPADGARLDHLAAELARVGLQDAHRRQGQPPALADAARRQHHYALVARRARRQQSVGQQLLRLRERQRRRAVERHRVERRDPVGALLDAERSAEQEVRHARRQAHIAVEPELVGVRRRCQLLVEQARVLKREAHLFVVVGRAALDNGRVLAQLPRATRE